MPDKPLTAEQIRENRESVAFIREGLKRRRIKQRVVASALNVSDATVSKWLSGKQNMTYAQLRAIAAIAGAKPEEMVGGPEDRARVARYQTLAELAGSLSDEHLATLELVARQLPEASRK